MSADRLLFTPNQQKIVDALAEGPMLAGVLKAATRLRFMDLGAALRFLMQEGHVLSEDTNLGPQYFLADQNSDPAKTESLSGLEQS